jgi:hypothetical protein
MLGWSAHALHGTWERWDVRRVGLFEPEVVGAFEAVCDQIKFIVILEEIAI